MIRFTLAPASFDVGAHEIYDDATCWSLSIYVQGSHGDPNEYRTVVFPCIVGHYRLCPDVEERVLDHVLATTQHFNKAEKHSVWVCYEDLHSNIAVDDPWIEAFLGDMRHAAQLVSEYGYTYSQICKLSGSLDGGLVAAIRILWAERVADEAARFADDWARG